MIGKLTTVLLECKNLKASEEFYVGKLGLKKTEAGETWLCVDGGGVSIVMWQGSKASVSIGFTGADLSAAQKGLAAKGVAVSPLTEHPGGHHHDVTDPDGSTIMIADQ